MARQSITICFDQTLFALGDEYPWFKLEGTVETGLDTQLVPEAPSADLLAVLDASGDYAGYHVDLDRGDGETEELR